MTKAQAVKILERRLVMLKYDEEASAALEALRPKARKPAAGQLSPAARTVARQLTRPAGWQGSDLLERSRYLDTFGPVGSPERAAQAARLDELRDGPSAEAFGEPEAVCWVARMAGLNWEDERKKREALAAVVALWRTTEQGQAFEAAHARHEARKRQFAYMPPKTRKDDERATFALAVLRETGGIVEPLPLEVAA